MKYFVTKYFEIYCKAHREKINISHGSEIHTTYEDYKYHKENYGGGDENILSKKEYQKQIHSQIWKLAEKINIKIKNYYDKILYQRIIFKNHKYHYFHRSKLPKKIQDTLYKELNRYVSTIKRKDYHPGSKKQFLDIIHPSLYPYIHKRKPKNKLKPEIKRALFTKANLDMWQRPYESSIYQWLPSIFHINNQGKCTIKSYINNLPESETLLYDLIAELFEIVLPQFEKLFHKEIRSTDLQVITKIVKIDLKNKIEGAWHVEGMSHEHILATASITLHQTDNFSTSISFKRFFDPLQDDFGFSLQGNLPQDARAVLDFINYNKTDPIGTHQVKSGDVMVFPNSHIHKVDMDFKQEIGKTPHRYLVVFWLISPEDYLKNNTQTIPAQQTLISLKDAKKIRLELMKERTYFKKSQFEQGEREINLCEH